MMTHFVLGLEEIVNEDSEYAGRYPSGMSIGPGTEKLLV